MFQHMELDNQNYKTQVNLGEETEIKRGHIL
jgi:hypothetical protein